MSKIEMQALRLRKRARRDFLTLNMEFYPAEGSIFVLFQPIDSFLISVKNLGNYVKIGLKVKSVNLNKPLGNVNRKNKSNNIW